MIGSYIDLTSEEASASSIYRTPVLKTIHHQNAFSNQLSLKHGIMLFWSSKLLTLGKNQLYRGTICLLHTRTHKFIKKLQIHSKILNIIPSIHTNELLILTDQGFYQCYGANGFSLSPFHKSHGLNFALPLVQLNSLMLLRGSPSLRVSLYNFRYHQELLILDYGFRGDILADPLCLESQNIVLFFSEVIEPEKSSLGFKRDQARILFTMFNYGAQKILHSSVHKFQGVTILGLNKYYPDEKSILLEYTTTGNSGHFLALWKIESKGFVETKKLNMDYFSSSSFKCQFLAVIKDYERVFLLVEMTSQKKLKDNLDCEAGSVSVVTFNTRKFEVEACGVSTNTEFVYSIELIKYWHEESQVFIGVCKNSITFLDNRALSKRRFKKPLAINEFEKWLKDSKIPSKVKKIILVNDIDY